MDELFIEAKLENMNSVMDFINKRIKDCPGKIQHQIEIAVDEAFSNITKYAYCSSAGNATVRIAVGTEIVIEFEDNGIEYNPLSADIPDISLPAEERKIGGLGVFILRKLMDSVEYRREENKNILTIKKRIT